DQTKYRLVREIDHHEQKQQEHHDVPLSWEILFLVFHVSPQLVKNAAIRSIRTVTHNSGSGHLSGQREVILNSIMLSRPVIPERDGVGLPFQAHLVFRMTS